MYLFLYLMMFFSYLNIEINDNMFSIIMIDDLIDCFWDFIE